MADLVTVQEFKDFLGADAPAGQDPFLTGLLDGTEELFESECGRVDRPFRAAQTARVEIRDGTGTTLLFLDYPIDTITSIVLGADPAVPDETLAPADRTVVSWRAGRSRITRVDGGVWGERHTPNVIHVTYDTLDELPLRAALAIKRGAASVFRRLGSEELRAERTSTFSRDFLTSASDDPVWQQAVRGLREIRL